MNRVQHSRRQFLARLTKSAWALAALIYLPLSAFWDRSVKAQTQPTTDDDGIRFIVLEGHEAIGEFRKASTGGGAVVNDLFSKIQSAVSQLPRDNSGAENAQEAVGTTLGLAAVQIAFVGGVMKAAAVVAGSAMVVASSTPAVIGVLALVAVAAITITFIEIAKDRNVSIMMANLSGSSFKIQEVAFSPGSGYAMLEGSTRVVEAKPVARVIPAAKKQDNGFVGTFITKKTGAAFDISGGIRLQDDELRNIYLAWHCPTAGKNAVAVGIIKPESNPVSAMEFMESSITRGQARIQQTINSRIGNKMYTISAGLSDEDSEFPKIIVTIEGPIDVITPREVTLNFFNKSVFPAYTARFAVVYENSDGSKKRWESENVPDGNSTSLTLPGDTKILFVNGHKLDFFTWKRIKERTAINRVASELEYTCYEAGGPVGNATFEGIRCPF